MFCFKCGNELKDDALFCTSCGAPTVNNLQALTEFEKNKNTAVEKAEETAEPEKAAEQEVKTAESEKPAEQEAKTAAAEKAAKQETKTAEPEKAAKQSTENDSAETAAAESSKASSEVKNESAEQANASAEEKNESSEQDDTAEKTAENVPAVSGELSVAVTGDKDFAEPAVYETEKLKTGTAVVPYDQGKSTEVGPYTGGKKKLSKKQLIIILVLIILAIGGGITAIIIHRHKTDAKNLVWSEMPKGKTIAPTELPMAPQLTSVLSYTYAWAYDSMDSGEMTYDSRKSTKCSVDILRSIVTEICCGDDKRSVYQGEIPLEYSVKNGAPLDPRARAAVLRDTYYSIDENSVEWVAENIFNLPENDMEKLITAANDENGAVYGYYKDNDRYYLTTGNVDGNRLTIKLKSIESVKHDGRYYYVKYLMDIKGRGLNEKKPMYAVMELKEIDGKKYWSVCYFSTKIPNALSGNEGVTPGDIIAEDCSKYAISKNMISRKTDKYDVTEDYNEIDGHFYNVHIYEVMYDKDNEGRTATVLYYRVFANGTVVDLWDISDETKNVPIYYEK